jgi:hypothetical protein
VLSNKTIIEHSKIDQEIKKTGILIYERWDIYWAYQ